MLGTYYYASGDVFKGHWLDGKKNGRGLFSSPASNQSFLEEWENGIRTQKREVKYYPTRLLKTSKESCDKKSEALRIRNEIDRLQNRLAVIQTQVSPHKPNNNIVSDININNNNNTNNNNNNTTSQHTTPQLSNIISTHPSSSSSSNPHNIPPLTIPSTTLSISVPPSPIHNRSTLSSADECERRHIEMMIDSNVDILHAAQSSPRRLINTPTHRSGSNTPHANNNNQQLESDHSCKVCMEQSINTVLIRCGHMVVCKLCATSLDRCPVCRSQIQEVIQVFKV